MAQQRILVTGGSRGIGRAIVDRLVADGWSVALQYASSRAEAEAALKKLGSSCSGVYQTWLQNPDAVEALIPKVLKDGPLDALVNNAGVYTKLDYVGATHSAFEASLSQSMEVNFYAPARLARHACQHFSAHGGGKVVNVCSRVGHRGEPGAAFYAASKAALLNLTRSLAVEHSPMNIQHYAIAPGWVETAMSREGMRERLPDILRDIPLGRVASPADCAGAVSFLLGQDAAYLSGVVIDINGASYLR